MVFIDVIGLLFFYYILLDRKIFFFQKVLLGFRNSFRIEIYKRGQCHCFIKIQVTNFFTIRIGIALES